jgi:hypothetical protein
MHRYLNRKRSVVAGSGRVDRCAVESHSRSVNTNDRCPVGAEMDTYSQPVKPKPRIVEETMIEGASVARVARPTDSAPTWFSVCASSIDQAEDSETPRCPTGLLLAL